MQDVAEHSSSARKRHLLLVGSGSGSVTFGRHHRQIRRRWVGPTSLSWPPLSLPLRCFPTIPCISNIWSSVKSNCIHSRFSLGPSLKWSPSHVRLVYCIGWTKPCTINPICSAHIKSRINIVVDRRYVSGACLSRRGCVNYASWLRPDTSAGSTQPLGNPCFFLYPREMKWNPFVFR